MASSEERAALLAVTCPWCSSGPGQPCVVPRERVAATERGKRVPRLPSPSTLDAGCHDARWRRALGHGASVLGEQVTELMGRSVAREKVSAGSDVQPW